MSINTEQDFVKWEGASRDTIDVKRIYIDICDDLVAGIWLSQLLYYFLPIKGDDGVMRRNYKLVFLDGYWWLPINRESWWDECRIRIKQYDRVVKLCEDDLNIVVTRNTLHGNKKKPHIRINWEVFLRLINDQTAQYAHFATSGSNEKDTTEEGGEFNKDETALSVLPSVPIETNEDYRSGRNGLIEEDETALPIETNRPEHNVKETFKEVSKEIKEEQQHHQVQAPVSPIGDDAVDAGSKKSEKKASPHSPKASTVKPKRTRHRELTASFESLEGERRAVAEKLAQLGAGREAAIEIAGHPGFLPPYLYQQIEWWPGAIADEEAKGKTVENPIGLLLWRIRNFMGKPQAFERMAREAEEAKLAAEKAEQEAAEKREIDAILKTLNGAQRRALDDEVCQSMGDFWEGQKFTPSSPGFEQWRAKMLRDPEILVWLKTIEPKKAKTGERKSTASKAVSASTKTNSEAGVADETRWKPTDARREARLKSEATSIAFDVQDSIVTVDEAFADLEGFDDNELAYIRDEVAAQLEALGAQKIAA